MSELAYQAQRRQAAELRYLADLDDADGDGNAARRQHEAGRVGREATVKDHFDDVPHGAHCTAFTDS